MKVKHFFWLAIHGVMVWYIFSRELPPSGTRIPNDEVMGVAFHIMAILLLGLEIVILSIHGIGLLMRSENWEKIESMWNQKIF